MSKRDYVGLLETLLQKHFGIGVNDTYLCEDAVIEGCLADEIQAFNLVNEVAQEADLVRIDLPGDYGVPSFRPLTAEDEKRALLQPSRTPSAASRGPSFF